jgi:hypothetical protein
MQFCKSPIVTWCHDYKALPVGKALWLKRESLGQYGGIKAKTQYHTKPDGWDGPWLPDAVFHLIKNDSLRGKSIGFLPVDASAPSPSEIKAMPQLNGVSIYHRKGVLFEYAVAPVQANADAVTIAVSKALKEGLKIPEYMLEEMGLFIPTPCPSCEDKELEGVVTKSMPEPGEKETQEEFVGRCMGNSVMNTDYPDQKQRAAVCYSQWRKKHPGSEKPEKDLQSPDADAIIREVLKGLDVKAIVQETFDELKGKV